MLLPQSTPQGRQFYEITYLLGSKNHQGGLHDNNDESHGKMFPVPNSLRCPVKTALNSLYHLNPELEILCQRPREASSKFQAKKDEVWFCNSPIGDSTLLRVRMFLVVGSLQSSQNTGMLETTTRIFIPHERNNSTQDFTTAHVRSLATLELCHSCIFPRPLPRYLRNLSVTL